MRYIKCHNELLNFMKEYSLYYIQSTSEYPNSKGAGKIGLDITEVHKKPKKFIKNKQV